MLQYRGRGWPGSMLIRLKDGTERTIPLAEYYRELGPYSLRRCTLCSDMLGELSDLTCGDAWVYRVMQADKLGSSFVVSRTAEAEELLEAAASNEAVELSELGLRGAARFAGQRPVQEEEIAGSDAAVQVGRAERADVSAEAADADPGGFYPTC